MRKKSNEFGQRTVSKSILTGVLKTSKINYE